MSDWGNQEREFGGIWEEEAERWEAEDVDTDVENYHKIVALLVEQAKIAFDVGVPNDDVEALLDVLRCWYELARKEFDLQSWMRVAKDGGSRFEAYMKKYFDDHYGGVVNFADFLIVVGVAAIAGVCIHVMAVAGVPWLIAKLGATGKLALAAAEASAYLRLGGGGDVTQTVVSGLGITKGFLAKVGIVMGSTALTSILMGLGYIFGTSRGFELWVNPSNEERNALSELQSLGKMTDERLLGLGFSDSEIGEIRRLYRDSLFFISNVYGEVGGERAPLSPEEESRLRARADYAYEQELSGLRGEEPMDARAQLISGLGDFDSIYRYLISRLHYTDEEATELAWQVLDGVVDVRDLTPKEEIGEELGLMDYDELMEWWNITTGVDLSSADIGEAPFLEDGQIVDPDPMRVFRGYGLEEFDYGY